MFAGFERTDRRESASLQRPKGDERTNPSRRASQTQLSVRHVGIIKREHGGSMFAGFERTDRRETKERIPPGVPANLQ